MLAAIVYNVLGQSGPQSAYIGKQVLRGGIKVDTNRVNTTLYGLVERVFQHRLVYIVLILAYAYALRIYLDQLGQRVHQSAAYGYGTAHGDILIGEFVAGHLRGRVDRGASLAHDEYLRLARSTSRASVAKRARFSGAIGREADIIAAGQHVLYKAVGFAAGGAITYRDGFYLVALNHLLQSDGALGALVYRRVGEDGIVVQQIALGIKAHHFATSAESRVDAHHTLLAQWGSQQ